MAAESGSLIGDDYEASLGVCSAPTGHPGEQDGPSGAGALPPLPPLPAAAAGHPLPSVQHMGQYGYEQPTNAPAALTPIQR